MFALVTNIKTHSLSGVLSLIGGFDSPTVGDRETGKVLPYTPDIRFPLQCLRMSKLSKNFKTMNLVGDESR